MKFLRTAYTALAAADDPQIRAMADAYQQRATELDRSHALRGNAGLDALRPRLKA